MGLETASTWDAVIEAEPALQVVLAGEQIDRALEAIATFVDLKTPFMLGHAQAVAELAARAAAEHGLLEHAPTLRRAGLVHGLGRLGISNSIWDKPGPLGPGEWERVRLHPYLTQRMLRQSEALAPLGEIVVQLRERLDGSGYPAGLSGAAISPAGADPRRSRRVSGDARAASVPGGAARRTRRRPSCGRRSLPGGWTPTRSRRCWERPAIASRAAVVGRPASRRGRSTCSGCSRTATRTRRSRAGS